ncbi:MAG: MmcB family DNA repair protein [Amaricoccus sp.]
MPGQRPARRQPLLRGAIDFAPLTEFVPAPGLRVDVVAVGPRGERSDRRVQVEPAGLRVGRKWGGYLPFCDRFWASTLRS